MIDWKAWVCQHLDLPDITDAHAAGVVEEIAQLLEEYCDDLRARGVPQAEAETLARNHIDDWETLRATVTRAQRSRRKTAPARLTERVEARTAGSGGLGHLLSDLLTDLYLALRTLRLSPASSLVVILTLALGIGATTAIYSVVDAVVLRPLPYPDAERLGLLTFTGLGMNDEIAITPSNVLDFGEQSHSLQELATYASFTTTITLGDGSMEFVPIAMVEPTIPPMLGIVPLLGRHLEPVIPSGEDADGLTTEALISEELWERHFGADPGQIGREIEVRGNLVVVVGIVPRGTRFLVHPEGERERIDVWLARQPITRRGNVFSRRALVRLAEGVSFEEASTELNGIAERNRLRDFQHEDGRGTYAVVQLRDKLVQDVKPTLYALMGAVGFVLLLTCVNVANLLLVRALRRRQEWAVRAALGASRGRIVRLGLAESLVLASIGGALGIAFAWWGLRLLPLVQPETLPRGTDIAISGPVLAFAAAVSLLTSLSFGLVPAWDASRLDLHDTLKEGGRAGAPEGGGRLSRALVAVQFALALILVVGAGLMARTFVNLHQVDVGFRVDGLLTFEVLPNLRMQEVPELRLQFYRDLIERLEALPGAESASLTNIVPLSGGANVASWAYDEKSVERFGELTGLFRRAMPGYFRTIGMPLLGGRDFNDDDVDNDRYVLIVSESMAAIAWPGESPIGKRVTIDFRTPSGMTELRETEVVGMAPSAREIGLHGQEPPTAYLPAWSTRATSRALVRTSGDPLALVPAVRALVAELGIRRPLDNVRTVQHNIDDATEGTRFVLSLVALFSGLAVFLASLGLYGVVSHLVGRRQHEIGVRMALGAHRRTVLRMVLRQGIGLAFAGLAVGTLGALAATRLIRSLLYGVAAWDPATFVGMAALLLLVATAACLLPAARASRIDPASALRNE